MLKKRILITLFVCTLGALYAWKSEKEIMQIRTDERPNIIFLLTDDQRYDALGCMGNTEIKTPHIDALAETGVLFDNYYTTTAICMASRASIMTGLYEHRTGCNFTFGALSPKKFEASYPVLLQNAGYYTGFAGKFGFPVKDGQDFNSRYHTNAEMPIAAFDWWAGWPGQGYYQTAKNEFMVKYAEEYPHVSTALGAASIDFIKSAKTKNQPFCLSVSFKAPHSPVSPDKKFDSIYEGVSFSKPPNYGKKGSEHIPKQAKLGRQHLKLAKRWEEDKYNQSIAKYYQLIYGIDQAVGMITASLKKEGLLDNTIIIYTTDNGYYCGSHEMGGKVLPYEEGARGPLIISGPEHLIKKAGTTSNALTGNIDMMPTILDLAQLTVPENLDGKSLAPILDGSSTTVKQHQKIIQIWGDSPTQAVGIVSNGFKYLYWFYGEGMEPKEELYNLKSDPYEMTNLVSDESYSQELKNMRKKYDDEVDRWGEECVKQSNYEKYTTLLDRSIAWTKKKDLLPAYDGSIYKRKSKKNKK